MQRTDLAEIFLENFSSFPLTWENVFRGTEYLDKTKKEVVDLLLLLRNEGIFISLKCQKDPDRRRGVKLAKWTNKNAKAALKQLKGGIRTSQNKGYWCEHPRRGNVNFKPNEIQVTHGIVLVETLEVVRLDDDSAIEIGTIPVSYFSVNDFLNILKELRTIKDIQRYLDSRKSLPKELLTTLGSEKTIYKFYILNKGVFPKSISLSQIVREVESNKKQIDKLIRLKYLMDQNSFIIENISDALSKRLEGYEKGLDKKISLGYDSPLTRENYLLMQNELCDLVLDERRKIGNEFFGIMEKVKAENNKETMLFKAIWSDSKPYFQYVLAASKGVERKELIKRSEVLIRAALAEYNKKRGMIITYNQDINNFEVVLVNKYEKNDSEVKIGKQIFSQLKMKDLPIERV